MSDSQLWTVFAFQHGDDPGANDETRTVPEWRLEDTLRWARHRGYDSITFTRTQATVPYRQPAPSPGIRHSG